MDEDRRGRWLSLLAQLWQVHVHLLHDLLVLNGSVFAVWPRGLHHWLHQGQERLRLPATVANYTEQGRRPRSDSSPSWRPLQSSIIFTLTIKHPKRSRDSFHLWNIYNAVIPAISRTKFRFLRPTLTLDPYFLSLTHTQPPAFSTHTGFWGFGVLGFSVAEPRGAPKPGAK